MRDQARPIYLDNQATTRCDPRVLDAMLPFFSEEYGNPHSVEHVLGQRAHDAVEAARSDVAALIGAQAREIVFTSGATESNNIAIRGAAGHASDVADTRRRVITAATEHKCVLAAVEDLARDGFEPVILPVRRDGLVDPDNLREALKVPTLLVSIMAVNNEIGVIQDVAGLAALTRSAGALFHTDAAQAAGKIPIDLSDWGVDLLSLSGHKFYGPKGIGALFVRRRPRVRLQPLFSGGGQERGLRSGTLPAPLIVGLGEACQIVQRDMPGEAPRVAELRDRLLGHLKASLPGLVVNGSVEARIGGNLNVTLPGISAADLMARMPDVYVSTGSACSSAEIEPSYVLRGIGLSHEEAARSLRISVGRFTSAADIDRAADAIVAAHNKVPASAEP